MIQTHFRGVQEAALVFNLLPATYVDPSWIEVPHPWRDRLTRLRAPAARQILSKHLLVQHGVDGCYDFDFSSVEKAVFLQSPRELHALAALAGLLHHRESLRRMVSGGVLARLATELGAATVERALVNLPAPDFLPPPETDMDRGAEALRPQLVASGASWLFGLLLPDWRAVAVRARLKFCREAVSRAPLVLDAAARASSVRYLQEHLLAGEALCPLST